MNVVLEQLEAAEVISPADRYLAAHLLALENDPPPQLGPLISLVSAQIRSGHVCLPLASPALREWLDGDVDIPALRASSLVGEPGEPRVPLILEGDRLYLARYHAWEQQIIQGLQKLMKAPAPVLDETALIQGLDEVFPSAQQQHGDWQRVAAVLALTRRLCLISGGPGTGKTWTLARILKLLRTQPGGRDMRIVMAAPTGKAAMRMTESLGQAAPSLLEALGPARTLHRLLGMRPGRVRALHGPGHLLPLDLLIVDEMSMVDLPMMARVMGALPPQARLILLGDHHQLASVEAGQVMADLVGSANNHWNADRAKEIQRLSGQPLPVAEKKLPAISDHLVVLQQSRRFDPSQGIGRLARAVNAGDLPATLAALEESSPSIKHLRPGRGVLNQLLMDHLLPVYAALRELDDPAVALDRLQQIGILCAVREGPWGVKAVNARAGMLLGDEGRRFYHGQPVMVTVNDYARQLFNGDIGLVWRDGSQGLRVYFSDGQGGLRALLPNRLPAHETVYAMTIHKSQGSEFDEVMLVLPEEDNPLVTRELLYTGITRARSRLVLCASNSVLEQALSRQLHRVSGLRDALWGVD